MKRYAIVGLCFLWIINAYAQEFTDFFQDKTLRIDYFFTGDAKHQAIYLDELSRLPSWAGRRHHLSELPLEGNGQIIMTDLETGKCIYKTSFSSLFQEWLSTDEAQKTAKGFENTFLVPYPQRPAEIEIILFSPSRKVIANLKHTVRPDDILIHERGTSHVTPHQYIQKSGNETDCIDVAIMAEGYTATEMELFYKDAGKACESLFFYEPFKSMKHKFNIIAVANLSEDSGVSVPRKNDWKHTAFGSHFDTFYSDRYLTTCRVKSIHNALAGIPYEHIIIIANTAEDDYSNDMDTISRHDTAYFHATLSGGEPSEEIELYYEIVWPNGAKQVYNLDSKWKSGSKITARFQYPIPLFGSEGKLTFTLYDKSTNEAMGSDSITFQN